MKALHLLSLAVFLSCASGGSAATPHKDPNVIAEEEMTAVIPGASMYDVIQRLRPGFLRSRSASSIDNTTEYPAVYLDGRRYGDLASLRNIAPAQVREVRYYDPSASVAKFGILHTSGVIDITSR